LVIGETRVEPRDIHNQHLSLEPIPEIIRGALNKVRHDLARLNKWETTVVNRDHIKPWVDSDVSKTWGKKAACRVFHICQSGEDVDFEDPFASGEASEKPVRRVADVPGAVAPVKTLFEASQALSCMLLNVDCVGSGFREGYGPRFFGTNAR
jgi:hypothetical protein